MSLVKMTLFELLQQSKSYKEAMNQILQEIQVDISNPNNFISIVESLKISQQPSINFYEQEKLNNDGPGGLDPPLHIIGKVDEKLFKRILIDEGSTINIISNVAYKNLNLPDSLILAPSLQIRAFNVVICSTLGSIVLPIIVGAKTVQTLLHIIEGNIIQYNVLLGRPWIREMKCVPSTYHGCLKYVYKDKVHCVFKDPDPYSHCN